MSSIFLSILSQKKRPFFYESARLLWQGREGHKWRIEELAIATVAAIL
jgi:hypothetical protein